MTTLTVIRSFFIWLVHAMKQNSGKELCKRSIWLLQTVCYDLMLKCYARTFHRNSTEAKRTAPDEVRQAVFELKNTMRLMFSHLAGVKDQQAVHGFDEKKLDNNAFI
jgi:hypothetical protein